MSIQLHRECDEFLDSLGNFKRNKLSDFFVTFSRDLSSSVSLFFSFGKSFKKILKVLAIVIFSVEFWTVSWWLNTPVFNNRFTSEVELDDFLQFVVSKSSSIGQPVNIVSLDKEADGHQEHWLIEVLPVLRFDIFVSTSHEQVESYLIQLLNLIEVKRRISKLKLVSNHLNNC